MRTRAVCAGIAFALAASLAPLSAAHAGFFWRDTDPDAPDRYPYVYTPQRYYPYYNSNYWRPAPEMRRPRPYYVQPPYYPAWGYPAGCGEDCREGPPLK